MLFGESFVWANSNETFNLIKMPKENKNKNAAAQRLDLKFDLQ